MLKKILMAFGILAAVIALLVVVVFQMTSGIADVANAFFTEIKAGNLDQAYDTYLSGEFKATASKAELKAFLDRSTLSDYADATWSSRSMENNQGKLQGTITTSTGGTVPLAITLVKENDEWKILAINLPRAGLTTAPASPAMPDDIKLQSMTHRAIYNLALAINAEDFTGFYNGISTLWQSQTTAEELKRGFKSFIEQKIDLTGIKGVDPVFSSPPSINDDGFLSMAGYFPTQPSKVHFKLDYTYEHPNWKLVGTSIDVK